MPAKTNYRNIPIIALSLISWVWYVSPADAVDAEIFESKIRPFLKENCIGCHGPEKQKADFRIDELAPEFGELESAAAWIEVRDMINLGEMPPEDEPVPAAADLKAVSDWIAGGVREAERAAHSKGGRVLLRRLNRFEYDNTIRDLLQMEFVPGDSPSDFLPADGTVEGFDTVAVGLMVDPSLMEKYYEVARRVADGAIVDGPPEFPTEVMRMEFEDIAENPAIKYLCERLGFDCFEDHIEVMAGQTRSYGRMFYPGGEHRTATPVRGSYRVSVRAGARAGTDGKPVRMIVEQSHPDNTKRRVIDVEVTATPDAPEVYSVEVPRDPDGGAWGVSPAEEVQFTMHKHDHSTFNNIINDAFKKRDFATVERYQGKMQLEGAHAGGIIRPDRIDMDTLPMLYLDWIEVEGPLYDQWPPKSHEFVFPKGTDFEPDFESISKILMRIVPRAWRRPVYKEEVKPYVEFVLEEIESGQSLEDAMRAGLAGILTSPHFLYLNEPSDDGESRDLTQWELASRLSYLLWSSMPDAELFSLAQSGKLSDPAVLEVQVDRMIADPKIGRFVDGFGAQWLKTRTFLDFEPDASQYRDYSRYLGDAMIGETLAFFREILTSDLDLRNFIDSEFTMVNDRLAKFYGIEGVKGNQFRRVALPADLRRGGLLGQSGVLMAGSDGDRTKPVSRGVYVLDVLFNDPPPPPPPNAGEVEPNIRGEYLSVRERLLQHQQIEACASCHRGIDSYGLALENYDVIGSWRTHQTGEGIRASRAPEIDATGKLPNGAEFSNPEEFKAILLTQDERFFRGLTEKLLVYTLGRPHLPGDRALIDSIAGELKTESPRMRHLLKCIVTSEPFRKK